ncbi:MAG: T9SS type A sorting domain-containing protein [Ignavibacteriaceae bacterium]
MNILKCFNMSIKFLIYIILFNFVLYAQEIRILPLGDSITKGSEGNESVSLLTGYRQSLWLSLDFSGYKVDFIGSNRYGCEATPAFDCDNAGFGGYTTSQILNLIKTGYDNNNNKVTNGPYLNYYTPDIILLHIGTNGLDTTTSYLEDLLNYIDDFEDSTNTQIWVILAKIINRVPYSSITTTYNDNIQKMFDRRVNNGEKLKIVDMENDAGLIYNIDSTVPYSDGDMYNNLHPNNSGNIKIANLFYDTLRVLLDNISLVRLEKFYPDVSQDSVILQWETSLELNNFGFEIERTTPNNGVWENLGFIEGSGNSFSYQWYAFIDNTLNPVNKVYQYRLKQIDNNGNYRYLGEIVTSITYTDIIDSHNSPGNYELSQNYPNPFNPSTNIRFQIPKTEFVTLNIYNTLGRKIATLVNEEKQPGNYEITWNSSGLPSGIYFYQIKTDNYIETKKMLLLK